ncbi:hypothetical protein CIB84_003890 [Bambusicola thoracicus]|uniref:Uncharacterized protein n=1 Tax=Bambusicola thoracicus TaxID=9083 RepID=A0A2P4T7L0_BAMTH|nr:hypothetical protein CIB84_003890 [Bambusicola thoracicus]
MLLPSPAVLLSGSPHRQLAWIMHLWQLKEHMYMYIPRADCKHVFRSTQEDIYFIGQTKGIWLLLLKDSREHMYCHRLLSTPTL